MPQSGSLRMQNWIFGEYLKKWNFHDKININITYLDTLDSPKIPSPLINLTNIGNTACASEPLSLPSQRWQPCHSGE